MLLPRLSFHTADDCIADHAIHAALVIAHAIYRVVVDLVSSLQFGQRQRISIAILAVCNIIAASRRHGIRLRRIRHRIDVDLTIFQPCGFHYRRYTDIAVIICFTDIVGELGIFRIPAVEDLICPILLAQFCLYVTLSFTCIHTHLIFCAGQSSRCRGTFVKDIRLKNDLHGGLCDISRHKSLIG